MSDSLDTYKAIKYYKEKNSGAETMETPRPNQGEELKVENTVNQVQPLRLVCHP